ncbi:unnamed protein product, partial [Nesidiocoris tenuis]
TGEDAKDRNWERSRVNITKKALACYRNLTQCIESSDRGSDGDLMMMSLLSCDPHSTPGRYIVQYTQANINLNSNFRNHHFLTLGTLGRTKITSI